MVDYASLFCRLVRSLNSCRFTFCFCFLLLDRIFAEVFEAELMLLIMVICYVCEKLSWWLFWLWNSAAASEVAQIETSAELSSLSILFGERARIDILWFCCYSCSTAREFGRLKLLLLIAAIVDTLVPLLLRECELEEDEGVLGPFFSFCLAWLETVFRK